MNKSFLATLLACGLTLQGCGLDKVDKPSGLVGPSELGLSLQVLVLPDVILADGIQTAVVQAVLQDQNGKRVAGKGIVFTILDESGRTAEIGRLTNAAGSRVFGSTTITTNANGIAQVVYTSPERRDFTADARIMIGARPVGTDATAAPNWTVSLELRNAEPRRFPEGGGSSPTCQFNVAPNNPVVKEGSVLRFSSTSFASDGYIVRYEWYFGDGSGGFDGAEGEIDVQHPYPNQGTFVATHIVTSNSGVSMACSKTITVVP